MTEEEVPGVGEAVHDKGQGRSGRVTGRVGPYLRVSPFGGGRAWDADPELIRRLTQDELLRELVAEANARSRQAT
ncbi:hypothetical protein ACWD5R_38830 [Streptomyces sp. NPDC002514]|uniref:hypothetical protein n=1 Tax=Streptomyces sp. NPDC001270 TaxID=3364554 RepID=UPI00369F13F3